MTLSYEVIHDATNFDAGDEFESEDAVRSYFRLEEMSSMFGPEFADQWSQEDLRQMAEMVINNRWHCQFADLLTGPEKEEEED